MKNYLKQIEIRFFNIILISFNQNTQYNINGHFLIYNISINEIFQKFFQTPLINTVTTG